ncbi:hypothetical protein HAT93_01420 [Dickeya solani]|nr:hypothetical protein [Dickeya solani]QKO15599.1 hypothetical protein HAT91_04026 [Dickeya solani]
MEFLYQFTPSFSQAQRRPIHSMTRQPIHHSVPNVITEMGQPPAIPGDT